jgi:hypothetical protein
MVVESQVTIKLSIAEAKMVDAVLGSQMKVNLDSLGIDSVDFQAMYRSLNDALEL